MRNRSFSIQTDEATDYIGFRHLTAYLRYVENTTINEDILFYNSIKRRPTIKELLKIIADFMKEESIKW
jgi:hypothetical protein